MSESRIFRAPYLVILAAAFVAAFGAWRFFSSDPAQAEPLQAALYNFEGEVSHTRKGVTAPAVVDMPILKGDSFKTGPESELDLTFGYYAGVKLGSGGELTVVSLQQISLILKLSRGTLTLNTKKLPSGMLIEIDTPNSIGRVRNSGTQLRVRVEPGASGKASEASAYYVVRKGPIEAYLKQASAAVNVLDGRSLDVTPEVYIPNGRNSTDEEFESVRTINQIPIAIPSEE